MMTMSIQEEDNRPVRIPHLNTIQCLTELNGAIVIVGRVAVGMKLVTKSYVRFNDQWNAVEIPLTMKNITNNSACTV